MSENAAESTNVEVDLSTSEANDGNYNSFDDLDQMTSTKSDAEVMKEAVKEAKESNEETQKVMSEVKEELSANKVSKNTKQENLEEIGDEVTEELVEEIKKLKASFGEEEYEVPQDAVFKVKLDGEEVDVSLQDLRNNWSGKTAWDRKFQELGQEKKQFIMEKSQVEKYVNEFGTLARAGDKLGAMQYLASLSGMDALQFRREMRDQVLNEYKEMLNMDETQQKAFEAQEENEFLKHKMESEKTMAEQYRQEQIQAQQIMEIQEALGVDEDQWSSLVSEVSEEFDGEITAEVIGQYAYAKEVYSTAGDLLSQVDSEVAKNEDIVEEVAEVMLNNPDLSQEDLLEIITEGLGIQQKRKPSKKAQTAAKQPAENNSPKQKSGSKLDTFYSFDQFDD